MLSIGCCDDVEFLLPYLKKFCNDTIKNKAEKSTAILLKKEIRKIQNKYTIGK